MLVAKVAYDDLDNNHPDILEKVNKVLSTLNQTQPYLTQKENNYPFVECATLPDDMKYSGWEWQSEWHYVDNPFFDDGGELNDYPEFNTPIIQNITLVIEDLANWVKHTKNYQDSETYKTITKYYSEDEGLSIAIRMIIHYMGDIH